MPVNNKLISIVIPTYNRSKLLSYTLKTIRNQSFDKKIMEIIVVDDGSDDDTRQVVQSFESDLSLRYFYQDDKGYRVASARNTGIENASGEIIIFVDSGMLLSRNFVSGHFDLHEQSAREIAVIGYMYGLQEERRARDFLLQNIKTDDPDSTIRYLLKKNKCLDIRQDVFRLCRNHLPDLPAPWVLFWTGNVSVKKEVLLKAGSFDTGFDLRWGMEDIDLGYRLFKNKIEFSLARKASSIHYPHASDTLRKTEEEARNKLYFHRKHSSFETETLLSSNTVELNIELTRKQQSQ